LALLKGLQNFTPDSFAVPFKVFSAGTIFELCGCNRQIFKLKFSAMIVFR